MALVLSGQGEKTSPILEWIRKYSAYLCYPLALAGIIWLLLLPLQNFSRRAYFSENAMMPGQAHSMFGADEHIAATSMIDSALAAEEKGRDSDARAKALFNVFEELGLDSEIQRFKFEEVPGVGETEGTNVHGILRAPRSDAVEALLIAASWTTSANKTNINAVRLMAGLAKYASEQTYWAKDVIFVVTDSGEKGIEAWLKAYHGANSGAPIHVRSGLIQAAMSLELPAATKYSGLGVFFEGKSGELPNLDFVNIVQRISQLEHIPAFLHGMRDLPRGASFIDRYMRSAHLLLRQVRSQAIGLTVGVHAPFLRYRIDALTISGIVSQDDPIALQSSAAGFMVPEALSQVTIRALGRTIESTMRSLNNLLEHFHQSFFFYILPANQRYISIGDYIPAAGLMVASLLVQAMHLWWMQGTDDLRSSNPRTRIERMNKYYSFLRRTLPNGLGIILRVHALGVLLLAIPLIVPHAVLTHTTSTAYVFTVTLASISMVLHVSDVYWASKKRALVDWRQLKALVEVYMAVMLACLSVMNFSLAVTMFAIAGLPLLLTRVCNYTTKAHRVANLVFLMATSPICILGLSRTALLGLNPLDFASSPFRLFLENFHHFSSLIYPLLCLVYWPVNLLCMVIALIP
ncbi:Glycosyl phosphatidyl inositol protein transamidase complex subunit [Coemansia sp. RSA 1813]|nr:Glycosyl phosphatidyl inositol protein transamidase complex subunit [Coemansia sp. RSA 1646]KAJ1772552.1 Glycosyl phosphatidyl inositol protein transamidase complex subunit [Coemansia sp. RSA 1843]KAJ2085601.1 Glycosyl phosphatidyl inositol protein transamidase complex subunit [Coemansia sp. RSA 986]KAJ2211929.1 Glycosyl phosphatidyl inositol protein transamidase complex subunit [Coemansia sp. RSA 487]KAJ2571219.1 Glycosyl phosphatidyl inositol protein transamidase complex subunit [Coemansia